MIGDVLSFPSTPERVASTRKGEDDAPKGDKSLAIWFDNGDTAFFSGVHDIDVTGKNLLFRYRSASRNGTVMQAEFFWPSIAGWSHGR